MPDNNTEEKPPSCENEEKKASEENTKDDSAMPSSSREPGTSTSAPGDKSNNNQDVKENEDPEMCEEELVNDRKENTLDCYYIILALVLGAILLGVLVYFAVSSLKERPLAIGNTTDAVNTTDMNTTYFFTTETTVLSTTENMTENMTVTEKMNITVTDGA